MSFFDMPKLTQPGPEHTFESALARLESLVSDMEGDRMPLEELIVAYEEGNNLVKICQQKLSAAEKKIEIIQKRASGEPVLQEFEPGQKSGTSTPPTSSGANDVSLF